MSDNWEAECSDDEKYEISQKWINMGGMEIPPADDIASLHEVLCVDRVLALEWRCSARRPLTPEAQAEALEPVTAPLLLENKNDDFDFDIDDMSSSQPKLPVRRREGELKGGARKKTASFDGVLSSMKRLWKLENEPNNQNDPAG